jgi:serine-type D-Ala-D-Ala carboxypeptidase/endopeptidase (penicillin-binding protein 4)
MKNSLFIYSFFLFLPILNTSWGRQITEKLSSENEKLKLTINKTANDPALKNGAFGFYAINTKTGEVLASNNSNQSLIPASTLKAVTTATALQVFGSKHRFKTILLYTGQIDAAGVLNGNIIIKGGGDPTLGSGYFYAEHQRRDFLKLWVKAVQESGIKKVKGSVIADAGIFSGELVPEGWAWGDIGNYYGAGAVGISVFDNTYEIEFSTGSSGEPAVIKKISPNIPYMQLVSEVRADNTTSDNSCIFGGPNSCNRTIRGTIPADKKSFTVKGSIPDPPLLTATLFSEELINFGIQVSENPLAKVGRENKGTKIHEQYSPSLDSIIYWINLKSNNSYAEHLINHLGLEKLKSGDTNSGTKALIDFWKSKGIDTSGMFITDGSGLSRSNGITAKQMAEILKVMAGSNEFTSFYNSLPIAGRTGSIAGSCKGTLAENNLRAKSGYLNRVRSYTGYVTNKSGHLIAFSMILNNYTCSASEAKTKLEKIMVALAESD